MINLNLEIEKAKNEFDDRNYERALEILDGLEVEGEYHKLAVMIRIASLMALKRYDDSLSVMSAIISMGMRRMLSNPWRNLNALSIRMKSMPWFFLLRSLNCSTIMKMP